MAGATAVPAHSRPGVTTTPEWRGRAFGLDVSSSWPLAGVAPVPASGDDNSAVRLRLIDLAELHRRWPDEGTRVFSQLLPDGRTLLELEEHETLGYRVLAPGHGSCLVSADGRALDFAPPEAAPQWIWERFLVAQMLPLAAVLQGLEVFHASAVAIGGRLVALSAGSGVGKTSVAVELVRRGARLFADDVLALDPACPRATCHPGPGAVNLRDERLKVMAASGLAPFGRVLGRGGRTLRVTLEAERAPMALDRLYLLSREPGLRRPRLRRVSEPDPLLAATFNFAIRTPARLARQLEGCSNVAHAAGVFELALPPDHGVCRTAALVERHALAAE